MSFQSVITRILRSIFLLVALLSGVATTMGGNPLPESIVVALKPDKNPDQMLKEREALAQSLSKILGRPVRVIVPLSATVIIEGLANGSIDLGWLSATDMVHARKADAAELLLVGEIDGRRDYSSLWLCLKEKPYESLEQLRGKPVAFASPTSTSGHLIPRLDLKKRGLIAKEPVEFFGEGNVWFGTGYMSGVERVRSLFPRDSIKPSAKNSVMPCSNSPPPIRSSARRFSPRPLSLRRPTSTSNRSSKRWPSSLRNDPALYQ